MSGPFDNIGRVSPFTVIILIECCTTPKPGSNIPQSMWESPAALDVRKWLMREEMIDFELLRATQRGEAWLKFICQTPLPIQKWILPEDGRPA